MSAKSSKTARMLALFAPGDRVVWLGMHSGISLGDCAVPRRVDWCGTVTVERPQGVYVSWDEGGTVWLTHREALQLLGHMADNPVAQARGWK